MRRLLLSLPAALLCVAAAAETDFQGRLIADVRYEPRLQPLSSAELERVNPVRSGDETDPEEIRRAILDLFKTGRFARVEAHAEEAANGALEIVFRTEPNWFVGDLRVLGVERLPIANQLATASGLRLGRLYTERAGDLARFEMRRALIEAGFPNPKVDIQAIQRRESYEVDLTFRVEPGPRYRFGGLVLTGDPPFDAAAARDLAKWDRKHEMTPARLDRGLDRLVAYMRQDGRLQARADVVGRDFNHAAGEIDFVIDVRPGPRVRVELEGADLSREKMELLIPIFEEGIVDEDLMAEGAANLRDFYQTGGYFDVRVDYREESVPEDERLVVYEVALGPRQKLTEVVIRGASFFDEPTIRERMVIEPASLQLRRGRFSAGLLDRDVETIRQLYRSNGFRDAEVSARLNHGPKDRLSVVIEIDEGEPTLVSDVKIVGMENFSAGPSELRLSSAPGQPFSESSIAADRDLILNRYFDAGFQDAAFDWSIKPAEDPREVSVEYVVHEGRRLFVDRAVVSGLDHTEPDLVNAMIQLQSGDPLSQSAMFESQRRLYDLGVFSKVEVALQNPEGEERSKNVLFQLEEARRWTYRFGGGAEFARIGGNTVNVESPVGNAAFSPRATLELTRLNFRGKGRTITFRTRLSNIQQRALLAYESPRWTGSEKWKMTLSGLYDTSRNVRTFASDRLEGALQFEQNLSKASTVLYRYVYRRTTIEEGSLQIAPLLIPLNAQPVRAGLLSTTYIQDRRDDPVDSTRGVFNTADVSVASGIWGSQPEFFRFLGQNTSYHRIGGRMVLARTVQLGVMEPWGDLDAAPGEDPGFARVPDPRIPISERFFAGGATSHRGFPINQAGPRDATTGFPIGGAAQFLNSVELRFPLIGENIGGVLFHDAGNVFSSISDISFSGSQKQALAPDGSRMFDFDFMVHAVGMGLRYRTPVGPVRFDLAYGLNPPRFIGFSGTRQELLTGQGALGARRISRFQFHFSLGQTF